MLHILCIFFAGFLIPFISRRLGKLLPATTGIILFYLPHLPSFPHVHNPLQTADLKRKWILLCLNGMGYGCLMLVLLYCIQTLLAPQFLIYAVLFSWIILLSIETDRRFMLLPDCLTIPLLLTGFLFSIQVQAITPFQSVTGAFFAYAITLFATYFMSFFRQTIFGGGDTKMLIALGAWIGIQALNYTIFLSFFLFSIACFFNQKRMGPYGPALGLAGLFSFFVLYAK